VRISLFLLSALLLLWGCSPEARPAASAPPPQAVRAVKAVTADVPFEISSIGNVEASSTVEVKARVTSPVVRVNFAEGDEVRQGQLLFELDAEPFRRQLAEIEANIARDNALARQAEANIARDDANYRNLAAIAARTLKLLAEGIASREQADQAQATADAAKAALDSARAALESARAAEKAECARLHETTLQIDYTKVVAPIAGRAGVISAKPGNLAKQNDNTLVTILQSTPIHVGFSVPEDLLPQIRKFQAQQPLEIAATTGDQTRTGKLIFIDNTVDATTGGIRLKAAFPNLDRTFWPGQFVNVTARLNTARSAVVVTSQAVQTGPRGKYVWVFDAASNTVNMRDVQLMRLWNPTGQSEQAVIASGLTAGEQVISEGQKRLTANAKVRLLANSNQASN
jgi:membrane fusion protein, multidrug efflux system